MVRLVFHQPLRQTEGLLGSLLDLMNLDLPVPDHTTISRRMPTLSRSPRSQRVKRERASSRRYRGGTD
jgi:hypothetical protein